jgi:hypothetical protein
MNDTFFELTCALRLTIFPLLERFDRPLNDYLVAAGMEPFFALSWILTWFSHDLKDTSTATRLFDAFMVSHPLLPIYVAIAMVTHPVNRRMICKTECDFAEIHNVLCSLPKNTSSYGWKSDGGYGSDDELDFEDSVHKTRQKMAPLVPVQELINTAINFMRRVPPRSLVSLAKKYDSMHDNSLQPFLGTIDLITLFKDPPAWALVPTVKSDWMSKKEATMRQKQDEDGGPRQLENPSMDTMSYKEALLSSTSQEEEMEVEKSGDVDMHNIPMNNNDAHTASGMGSTSSKRKKAIKLMFIGGMAFVIVYVALAYYAGNHATYSFPSTCVAPTTSQGQGKTHLKQKWLPTSKISDKLEALSVLAGSNKPKMSWTMQEARRTSADAQPARRAHLSGQTSQETGVSGATTGTVSCSAEDAVAEVHASFLSHLLNPKFLVSLPPVKLLLKLRPRLSWLRAVQAGMMNIVRIIKQDIAVNDELPLD